MKLITKITLFLILTSACYGDVYTSHQLPNTDSTLDVGSAVYLWRYIYGDSFTDGTALWDGSSLSGFSAISGSTLTDGNFSVTSGIITGATWNGNEIDISSYTNLLAGTNITLSGDTLNVDDAFLVNDASDTTTGTLTAAGFTTTGTVTTDGLIIGSNAPESFTSPGTTGTITYDENYIYVCWVTNRWKRAALGQWDLMLYENSDVMLYEDSNFMEYD